jgi:hypothetical protein
MSVTIYETDIGFKYTEGISAGTTVASFPIPGLSIGVPGLGDLGVYAGIDFQGNADSLTIDGNLDLCGEIAGEKECGSRYWQCGRSRSRRPFPHSSAR